MRAGLDQPAVKAETIWLNPSPGVLNQKSFTKVPSCRKPAIELISEQQHTQKIWAAEITSPPHEKPVGLTQQEARRSRQARARRSGPVRSPWVSTSKSPEVWPSKKPEGLDK
ncbi:MAG: hypothetical protein KTR25_06550 [Myxococcales bacterium]|nr:hypothetical protein [Myxococcales bacterium]